MFDVLIKKNGKERNEEEKSIEGLYLTVDHTKENVYPHTPTQRETTTKVTREREIVSEDMGRK